MNKKLIGIIVAILALLLIAGGVYMATRGKNDAASDEQAAPSKENIITSTFPDLIKNGKDLSCTFTTTDEQAGSTEGTIYIAEQGNKIRGNFYTKPSEQHPTAPTTDMHLIVTNQTEAYYWSEQGNVGYRMKFDPNGGLFANKPMADAQTEVTTQDQNYDFDCQAWTPDQSVFVVPSSVTFSELPHMAAPTSAPQSSDSANVNATSTGSPMFDCSMCDRAPEGAQRDACKQAIGC